MKCPKCGNDITEFERTLAEEKDDWRCVACRNAGGQPIRRAEKDAQMSAAETRFEKGWKEWADKFNVVLEAAIAEDRTIDSMAAAILNLRDPMVEVRDAMEDLFREKNDMLLAMRDRCVEAAKAVKSVMDENVGLRMMLKKQGR